MKLEEKIGQWLVARRMTLAVAESCTGGLVGHRLTNVPGSSEYFLGGIIAYSNDAKQRLLGVSPDTLARFGAISQETVQEMAQGARRALEAHLAVAVTGIAGPGGGAPGKPVGLTWIALSAPDLTRAVSFHWPGDRQANKEASAQAALELLQSYLEPIGGGGPSASQPG